ncbi:RNA-guided endonuclease InsQ/TnpB family protein [Nocardia terpenica]|uniref:Transposase n=1 Tax=Nocardia terpenica TaxID=455432 RepID=A0A291RT66_9NOCA|nr:RNA-guided endonuclease TnpB family protein [Nocardia terpenica]ATL70736.1 transposase [Nocardia terpenica]
MLARYRYRIEPTPSQAEYLSRVFGCCRVVFNDALRVREEARRTGTKLSDTEIQRRVITVAKTTEERTWLAEVPSVALVQAVNDARRAFRNFFDSAAGVRKGRRIGRPRMKSKKDHKQSFRLTRNGFRIRSNGRLYVAKIGDIRVRWSRELPSEPSSVTVIREADGHFYASFVVDVPVLLLPDSGSECGVDMGIARLATVASTAGSRTDIGNPKYLKRSLRKLARLQREQCRREVGSRNREKSRRKVAVQSGKVARSRRDYHHKQALSLVHDNQVIYIEDLNIATMVRNSRLARAIGDAGWGGFTRIIGEKCMRHGRVLHRVSRWLPSSKTCSSCGYVLESLALGVREWTCRECGIVHDRDYNAAENILAAGRAERINDGGAEVSPSREEAHGNEAGSVRGAVVPNARQWQAYVSCGSSS